MIPGFKPKMTSCCQTCSIMLFVLVVAVSTCTQVSGCTRQPSHDDATTQESSLRFHSEMIMEEDADNKTWLFAVDGRKKPYSFLDDNGQLVGFDVDLVARVCQQSSKKCSMVLAEFTECAYTERDINVPGRGLMAEWFDGCPSYTISVDRTGGFDFTLPYLETACTFTVLPGNPSNFDPKSNDYSQFTLTHLSGAVSNSKCLDRLGKKFGNMIIASNLPDAKNLLNNKTADALFSPRTKISDLEVLPDKFHCEEGGAGVMTKKGSLLSSWWNPTFTAMISSGEFQQFCRESSAKYQATFKCLNSSSITSVLNNAATGDEEGDKTWLFAVSGRRKPFNYLDDSGLLVGFDVDFIASVCKIAGKKCDVVLTAFTECSFTNRNINYPGRGLMEEWFDACVGYANSLDRQNSFDFTDAYLQSYTTYSVLPGNPSGFNPNATDFSNFTFTHLTGAYTNAECLNRLHKTVKRIVIAENLPDAKRILQQREADVLLSPRGRIPDLETFPEKIHCEETGTSMMVKKGSSLPSWWNQAFRSFVQEGGYQQLCQNGIVKYNFPIKCFT